MTVSPPGRRFSTAMVIAFCLSPGLSWAHGAHFKPYGGEVRAYVFEYSLGEPVARADVMVFPPEANAEFQSGKTDALGVFAFAPNRPGTWRLEVRDGKGHAIRKYVNVGVEAGEAVRSRGHEPPAAAGASIAWLALAVSLLANAILGLGWLQSRRSNG